MNYWMYKSKKIYDFDDGVIGFVYKISYEDDNNTYVYYGKKNIYTTTKKYLTKKEMAGITDKRLKNYKMVKKESNWLKYCGSCKDDIIKKCKIVEKEILQFAYSNTQLTYLEAKTLFINNALEDNRCLNGNILGKFFKNNI